MTLTPSQAQAAERILAALLAYQLEHGIPPTLRELAAECDYSMTGLGYYLPLMQAAGLIEVEPRVARGIRVL